MDSIENSRLAEATESQRVALMKSRSILVSKCYADCLAFPVAEKECFYVTISFIVTVTAATTTIIITSIIIVMETLLIH